jgi:hypothetical protein
MMLMDLPSRRTAIADRCCARQPSLAGQGHERLPASLPGRARQRWSDCLVPEPVGGDIYGADGPSEPAHRCRQALLCPPALPGKGRSWACQPGLPGGVWLRKREASRESRAEMIVMMLLNMWKRRTAFKELQAICPSCAWLPCARSAYACTC